MGVINWDYGVEVLRNRVVRVVFEKKGNGAIREMWATRNPGLIQDLTGTSASEERLGETREKLHSQKNNNNIVVFDLEVEGFRTIPLDNILSVDNFNGVDGWIEFDIGDDWNSIIKGKTTISKYING